MHLPIITCLVHRVLSTTKCLRNVTCSETSIICSLFWAVHSFCSRWALDKKNKTKHNQTFWAGSRTRTPPYHCQRGKWSQNPSLQPLLMSSSLMHSPTAPKCCCRSTALPMGHDVQCPLFQEGLSSIFSLSLLIFLCTPVISNDC